MSYPQPNLKRDLFKGKLTYESDGEKLIQLEMIGVLANQGTIFIREIHRVYAELCCVSIPGYKCRAPEGDRDKAWKWVANMQKEFLFRKINETRIHDMLNNSEGRTNLYIPPYVV